MAHQEQIDFCKKTKETFSEYFKGKIVVDIGSLDVNGNNRNLFEQSLYIGIDVAPGKNVDFVSPGGKINFPDESIDVVISTECFEHDNYYKNTLRNVVRMLKPGGFFIFTCATTGRPEHGTARTTPGDAPLLQDLGEWANYYKNLDEADIREAIDVDQIFNLYKFEVNHKSHDLYFYGVKVGESESRQNYSFLEEDRFVYDRIADLEMKIKAAQKSLDAQRVEGERMRDELNLIYASRSWRITTPLRKVCSYLRVYL